MTTTERERYLRRVEDAAAMAILYGANHDDILTAAQAGMTQARSELANRQALTDDAPTIGELYAAV
jgi:hypothetical protein